MTLSDSWPPQVTILVNFEAPVLFLNSLSLTFINWHCQKFSTWHGFSLKGSAVMPVYWKSLLTKLGANTQISPHCASNRNILSAVTRNVEGKYQIGNNNIYHWLLAYVFTKFGRDRMNYNRDVVDYTWYGKILLFLTRHPVVAAAAETATANLAGHLVAFAIQLCLVAQRTYAVGWPTGCPTKFSPLAALRQPLCCTMSYNLQVLLAFSSARKLHWQVIMVEEIKQRLSEVAHSM